MTSEGHPVPEWLRSLASKVDAPGLWTRVRTPASDGARPAAVLMLFGNGEHGPDVLLIERSPDMRSHAGQPAFPGGATDPGDSSPVETALREAEEEVGLDPSGVHVLRTANPLYLPASHYLVTPVLAWWHTPHLVAPVDPAETASVARVPIAELVDPANRIMLRHPHSGYTGPAFRVRGMVVWGFTAGLVESLLALGGWAAPLDDTAPVDEELLSSLVPGAWVPAMPVPGTPVPGTPVPPTPPLAAPTEPAASELDA